RPSTYGEWSAFSWQANMANMSSMLASGVFDRYPELQVLLIGGGVLWVTGQLWRLDGWRRMNTRESFSPKLPGEYFADHIRLRTYQIEPVASPEILRSALETIPEIERVLVYTSAFPNRDWEDVGDITKLLPAEWHSAVLQENAEALFRWPSAAGGREPQ